MRLKISSYISIFLLTFFWSIYRVSAAYSLELLINNQSHIIEELPQNFSLRLPSEQWIEKLIEPEQEHFFHVIPASDDTGMGIGVFNCKVISPDCLIASFSAIDRTSATAQDALRQHQRVAAPITLAPEINGYLREASPSEKQNSLSSVVWVQDNQLHAIRFPSQERQLGLYLARSMATSAPIKGQKTITLRRSPIKTEPALPTFNSQVIDVEETELIDDWVTSVGSIPPNLLVRVPQEISDFSLDEQSNLTDEYFTNLKMLEDSIETSIYSCQDQSPDCLIGIFSSSTSQSEEAQLLHEWHKRFGYPLTIGHEKSGPTLTIGKDIKAYVFNSVDGVLASMSWKQNDHIYGIKFPIAKRQNMLFAALSMVSGPVLEFDPDIREIRGVEISGSTLLNDADFQTILERENIKSLLPEGGELQEVERSKLVNVATAISGYYFNEGYITSSITPPKDYDNLRDDLVFPLEISEGKIGNIDIKYSENSSQLLNESYIRQRIENSLTEPLRIDLLEDQLRLLSLDDNIEKIDSTIESSGERGLSNLIVTVTEAPSLQTKVTIDNASPPRIGSERYGVTLKGRNFTGIGDSVSASYFRSTSGGSDSLDFRYTLPINSKDGTLEFSVAPQKNEVIQSDFSDLGLRGETVRYGLQLRQPVIRSVNQELALSLKFTRQTGQTFVFNDQGTAFGIGPEEDGTSRTSVLTFGQEYFSRGTNGAWTINSQLNLGTGLFGVTSNPLPIPDGHFFSWLLQAQRLQRLNSRNLLILGADLQLTPHTLLSSQQFTLGGGKSLPGFRQNARSGDNGFRLSLENRVTLTKSQDGDPQIQLAPFAYAGSVWNTTGNPNASNDQQFLASVGVAGIWDWFLGIEGLKVRFDYAIPLVDLEDRGNNAQDEGFHFQLEYQTK